MSMKERPLTLEEATALIPDTMKVFLGGGHSSWREVYRGEALAALKGMSSLRIANIAHPIIQGRKLLRWSRVTIVGEMHRHTVYLEGVQDGPEEKAPLPGRSV